MQENRFPFRKEAGFEALASRYLRHSRFTVSRFGEALYHSFCRFMGKPPRTFLGWFGDGKQVKRYDYYPGRSAKNSSKAYSELTNEQVMAWQKAAQRLTYWIFVIFDRYIKANCIDRTEFTPGKLKIVEKLRATELDSADAQVIMAILEKELLIRGRTNTWRPR